MKNNYSVYQHVTPDGMYYFGQTNNIKRRWEYNGIHYKKTSLQPYIEKYGWDNIQHIVLFKEQTRENALWIENFLIETAQEDGVCINKQRSGLISKEEGYQQQISKQHYEENRERYIEMRREHYQKNKDKIREQHKKYREEHKEQIKEYRHKNRDKIREQSKQYYETNKDKIKETSKQYYEKNKDKRLEYQRQYRKRKKLEKQLKEVQTTLF